MPPKRKTEDSTANSADPKQAIEQTNEKAEEPATQGNEEELNKGSGESSTEVTTDPQDDESAAKARQRQERFKALQARAVSIPSCCCEYATSLL